MGQIPIIRLLNYPKFDLYCQRIVKKCPPRSVDDSRHFSRQEQAPGGQ